MRNAIILFLLLPFLSKAQISINSTGFPKNEQFVITENGQSIDLLFDAKDDILVSKVASFLATDLEKVTGIKPRLTTEAKGIQSNAIIIGSIEGSALIKSMVKAGKLDVSPIKGQWERFIIQTVKNPVKGVKEALVIAGSDKRGAAFGTFTISEKIGVSPWYYWADAPIKKNTQLYLKKGRFISKAPSVKYRGIFLNDEAPALRNWAKESFGGFNHQFYEKVFELLLRQKANYLWPAMWQPSVFSTDDPLNMQTADEYGIVISTSHHEPMMRYHEEWSRAKGGDWNYETNKEKLQQFWRDGIKRMGTKESVVTLGMRGDGDQAMSENTAVDLLQRIIVDQRKIIAEETGKAVEKTPQVWALYKEVQDYYDKGMRVADDVLVLFCDDNWGNVRILPKKEDLKHKGGYGMYYHFDFVGGPVSYRWINVSQIERVWEQMNLSYEWGVKDLWIVNVGDLKPMELPISLFLDFAYDTSIKGEDLPDYYVNWSRQQFGAQHAEEIADIIARYTKYSARRTPEMLKPDTYSLDNYREADRILAEYHELLTRSTKIYQQLPETHKSAFYQLVQFPIEAAANLNEMYIAAGKNAAFGNQSRASTNYYADLAKEKFLNDAKLTKYYHEELEGGKWNHMMSQTHIGYTTWSNPPVNKMPAITYLEPEAAPALSYLVEGAPVNRFRRTGLNARTFSTFDLYNQQEYYVEVFNRGIGTLNYEVSANSDWIRLSKKKGAVELEEKVYVSIDWTKAPEGTANGEIYLESGGQKLTITVPINNQKREVKGFVENNGVIAIEAAHYSATVDDKDVKWSVIPNLGRTLDGVTVLPSNAETRQPSVAGPHLEYTFTSFTGGDLKLSAYLSPTLNYKKKDGLKFGISMDDGEITIVNVNEGENVPDWEYPDWWNNAVTDHIRIKTSEFKNVPAGVHTFKVYMIDPGLVFQRFVIDAGGLKPSYLGPPESKKF